MKPYKQTARRITERHAKNFFLSYSEIEERAVIQRDKLAETDKQKDSETGRDK